MESSLVHYLKSFSSILSRRTDICKKDGRIVTTHDRIRLHTPGPRSPARATHGDRRSPASGPSERLRVRARRAHRGPAKRNGPFPRLRSGAPAQRTEGARSPRPPDGPPAKRRAPAILGRRVHTACRAPGARRPGSNAGRLRGRSTPPSSLHAPEPLFAPRSRPRPRAPGMARGVRAKKRLKAAETGAARRAASVGRHG